MIGPEEPEIKEAIQREQKAFELRQELRRFTGSEQFYRHFLGLVYTEGVKYLADKAGAHWLLEVICSHQRTVRKRLGDEFQFWRVVVHKDRSAEVVCYSCLEEKKAVLTQRIEYTDFPLEVIDIWVNNRTMYLPTEE